MEPNRTERNGTERTMLMIMWGGGGKQGASSNKQDALNGHKSVPQAPRGTQQKKRERRTEAAAAQVITKTEYKSKTLSMAFIIARFVERKRQRKTEGEVDRGLVSTAGAFGWTIGHRDKTATDCDCDCDWLPAWPLVLSLTLSLFWL